jgi:hypothetical protein
MKKTAFVSGFLAGALLAGVAVADVIRLRNGNTLQGEARVLPNGDVEVHSAMGVWTVKADRVLEVVQAESAEERVANALARRPPPGLEELVDLAIEIRDDGSVTLSRRLLERVVAVEPDHAEARQLLGQRRLGESWVSEEEYRIANGEVLFRGEWTRSEVMAKTLELEALEAMRDRAEAEQRLQTAQAELAYQEQLLRLQEQWAEPPYGFPVDTFWGWGGWWPVVPVVPIRPHVGHHDGRPGIGPPSRPAPPTRPPAMVAPQHNRSSMRPGGN